MNEQSLTKLKNSLEKELIGEIPLYFSSVFHEKMEDTKNIRLRKIYSINVEDYGTNKFPIPHGYYKPISKMITRNKI